MANTYSLAIGTTNNTSATPAAEFRAGASNRAVIMEAGLFLGLTATASVYEFGRPAAIGVTPSNLVLGSQEDSADTNATAGIATAWTTAPTIPAHFFRIYSLSATIGAGVIYTWNEGQELVVPAGGSIVWWNAATNSSQIYIYVKWRE